MTRTILVGDIRTGRGLTSIPVSNATWDVAHRGMGTISVDIPLNANEFRRIAQSLDSVWRPSGIIRSEFLDFLKPAKSFMAVLEGDNVIAAGPIWVHDYSWDTGILKVKASGSISSIFDHRYVMAVLSSGYAAWSVTYSAMSLATIAKRLVSLLMTHTGGDLPIVLPADEASTNTRTYNGWELATVQSRLDQLMGVVDGPDIRFDPRLTSDRLGIEWVMNTGTVAQPLLFAPSDFIWDFRVPKGGVGGLSVHRDAGGVASRSWATGAGMDTALLMSQANDTTLTDAGYPLLENADQKSTVDSQTVLDGWAASDLAASARPMMTVSAVVRADQHPLLGEYRVGDFVRLWPPVDHPYLSLLWPAGYARVRIIGFSGNMGPNVALTFAPLLEGR